MNEKEIPKHTGVPSFFGTCCWEASQGGMNTYANAGWHLAIHVSSDQAPYDADPDDWEDYLEKLRDACSKKDEDLVWDWFQRHYPECMKLVPSRRKEQFVKGVLQAWEDGRID